MSVLDNLTISQIAALSAEDENTGTVPHRTTVIAARVRLTELCALGDVIGSPAYGHLLDRRAREALGQPAATPILHRSAAA